MKKTFKKVFTVMMCLMLTLALFAGCGSAASASASVAQSSSAAPVQSVPIRIAGLKGPTTMGMVNLMAAAEAGTAGGDYQVSVYGTADEVTPLLVQGELDAAMVPCNLASVLYNKTEGEIVVCAVNTLGVLYMVETGDTVHTVADLAGKTIYTTGKGTTPEYALNYVLAQNGLEAGKDVTIEYLSEATEVAAKLGEEGDIVAMLPQPYVTSVQMQNENVRVALDINAEFNASEDGASLVTGVLVARKSFVEENKAAFDAFLQEYAASIELANTDVEGTAALVEKYGIVAKAAIAQKALPACNITYMAGADMKTAVSGYLQTLFDQNPAAVGGTMPGDDFYYGA